MSMPTVRRATPRRKYTLATGAATAAMIALGGVAAVQTTSHPVEVVAHPAAEAFTMPVAASSNATPALAYLSTASLVNPILAKATGAPAPKPSWELSNISHSLVDKWVKRFTTSLKAGFQATLQRGKQYDDMILSKLQQRDMPQELYYLAMIESEFKPAVKSHASAVGLWQFMAGTARQVGLKVTGRSDERKSPSKSTDAALTYLSQLHDQFGSWYLAAAAYNAGPGAVSKALKQVTGRTKGTDADFYRIAPRLPAETRDYVPKLIAAARVAKSFGD
jgi:membrane-bound lytic murein transglycosylase D